MCGSSKVTVFFSLKFAICVFLHCCSRRIITKREKSAHWQLSTWLVYFGHLNCHRSFRYTFEHIKKTKTNKDCLRHLQSALGRDVLLTDDTVPLQFNGHCYINHFVYGVRWHNVILSIAPPTVNLSWGVISQSKWKHLLWFSFWQFCETSFLVTHSFSQYL